MNPILWTQKQDAGPSARQFPAMAYDSSRGRTVLFGGGTGTTALTGLNDTWEWDGEHWTQVADTGPPGRLQAVMAYDVHRNQTVLFGGTHGKADTWGWDGRNWTQLADSGAWPRVAFAMAYDQAAGFDTAQAEATAAMERLLDRLESQRLQSRS